MSEEIIGYDDKRNDSGSQANVRLNELLNGRCATCKHWDGPRDVVFEELKGAIDKEKFLSLHDTWAACGHCPEIWAVCSGAEPEGVFGCILYCC